MGAIIPVAVIGLPLIFVIIISIIKSRETGQRNRLRAEVYKAALERGEQVPERLFEEPPKKKNNSLKTGILLLCIGIGITIFGLILEEVDLRKAIAMGVIPVFLGIGFLIIHLIWKKNGWPDEE